MKKYRIESFKDGWFVGNFQPSLHVNPYVEVAFKVVKPGETELPHKQLKATELTCVAKGLIELNGKRFSSGDVIEISPGEIALFNCIEEALLICVKFPSIPSDKILV